jgi:hypothetical protein
MVFIAGTATETIPPLNVLAGVNFPKKIPTILPTLKPTTSPKIEAAIVRAIFGRD